MERKDEKFENEELMENSAEELEEQELLDQEQTAEKESVGTDLFDWAKALVTAVVAIVVVFTFFFRIVGVDGSSMNPTLNDGDRVILRCIGYEPEQGDIVVLTKDSFSTDSIVKRVIATEGQTVDIDTATGQVLVDGVPMTETYVSGPTTVAGDMIYPLTVKKGHIFVMGDNRGASTDSRFTIVGEVDERCVHGKVVLRVFPLGAIGKVD